MAREVTGRAGGVVRAATVPGVAIVMGVTATLEPDFGREWEYRCQRANGDIVAVRRCANDGEALEYGTRFVLAEHGGHLIVARVDASGVATFVAELE